MTSTHDIAHLIEAGGDPYEMAETIFGLFTPYADPLYTDGFEVRPKDLTTTVVLGIPYRAEPSEAYPRGVWVYPCRGSEAEIAEDKIGEVVRQPVSALQLQERAGEIVKRLCPDGCLPTPGAEQDMRTLAQLVVLAKRGEQASVFSTNFVNDVHALIYSMIERGVAGEDPWWGQEFLAVSKALRRRGLGLDPGETGVKPMPPFHDIELENGMRVTLEIWPDRTDVTLWNEAHDVVLSTGVIEPKAP